MGKTSNDGNHSRFLSSQPCEARGFSLEHSGQFGIGVLSYFILADKLRVETWTGGTPTGLVLESNGINDGGTLRRFSMAEPGTRVRLYLREEYCSEGFAEKLDNYIKTGICRSPCKLRYETAQTPAMELGPGWAAPTADLLLQNISEFGGLPHNARKNLRPLRKKMGEHLRTLTKAGRLTHGLGRYRIVLPYFLLRAGETASGQLHPSRAFFGTTPGGDWQQGVIPFYGTKEYLNSTVVENPEQLERRHSDFRSDGVLVELDFNDHEWIKINVARNTCSYDDRVEEVIRALRIPIQKLIAEFENEIENNAGSFREINRRLYAGSRSPEGDTQPALYEHPGANFSWFYYNAGGSPVRLGPVPYPLGWLRGECGKSLQLTRLGRPVHQPARITVFQYTIDPLELMAPDRVLLADFAQKRRLVAMRTEATPPANCGAGPGVLMPPEWSELCHVSLEPVTTAIGFLHPVLNLWNREHPLLRNSTRETLTWAQGLRKASMTKPGVLERAMTEPAGAAAWLLSILARAGSGDTVALPDKTSDVLGRIWRCAFSAEGNPPTHILSFQHILEDPERQFMLKLDPDNGLTTYSGVRRAMRYLPDPVDEEWWLRTAEHR